MKRVLGILPFLLLTLAVSAGAEAQPLSPRDALVRLFTAEQIEEAWFAPSFLAQAPITQIRSIVADLTRTLGTFEDVEPADEGYLVRFAGGTVPARIVLDGQGRISGLLFGPPRTSAAGSPEEALAPFRDLSGRLSVLVLEDGEERAALAPDVPLAVGSTFKLAVLAALREQIASGQRAWSDVVALRPEWRSLPSGVLQDWPEGAPLTLDTLASLMISISDNTATDALIAIAGREAVETYSPRTRPFPTTREAFILKDPANRDLLDRYRAADEAGRRAILAETRDRPLPRADAFDGDPLAPDVEWFFTVRETCDLISRVADLPLMTINPGVAERREWARVAYKGGSESGVLNLTTWLEAADGRRYCVAATWNDDGPLEEDRLLPLVGGLIGSLRSR